ncbi:MAG: transposase [Thermoanaerobaculia bacterium]
MPRAIRVDGPGAVHHVIARGNEQKPIFRDETDRRRFLGRLDRCHPRFGFTVFSYCLMGNHLHLAIRTGTEPLARVVLTVLSAYASDFNRRHRRVGHLFQGRYKAFRIGDDRHLLAVVRYIHRNPVAAGIVAEAAEYPWSSDPFYRRNGRGRPRWLDVETVLGVLSPSREESIPLYRELIDAGASSEDDVADLPSQDLAPEALRIETPSSQRSVLKLPGLPLVDFAAAVSNATGKPLSELRSRKSCHDLAVGRALTALIARNLAGIPLCRTANYFCRDESVIVRGVARLERRLEDDGDARGLVNRLEAELLKNAGMHD